MKYNYVGYKGMRKAKFALKQTKFQRGSTGFSLTYLLHGAESFLRS